MINHYITAFTYIFTIHHKWIIFTHRSDNILAIFVQIINTSKNLKLMKWNELMKTYKLMNNQNAKWTLKIEWLEVEQVEWFELFWLCKQYCRIPIPTIWINLQKSKWYWSPIYIPSVLLFSNPLEPIISNFNFTANFKLATWKYWRCLNLRIS